MYLLRIELNCVCSLYSYNAPKLVSPDTKINNMNKVWISLQFLQCTPLGHRFLSDRIFYYDLKADSTDIHRHLNRSALDLPAFHLQTSW